MSTRVPGNGEALNQQVDVRVQQARDLAVVRQIAIANIANRNAEQAVIFQQQQQALYPNITPLVPTALTHPPVEKQIIDDPHETDPLVQANRARKNLEERCDAKTAQYILDRLRPEDIVYLNQHWGAIVSAIRGERVNKDVFVNFIRSRMRNNHDPNLRGPQQVAHNRLSVEAEVINQRQLERLAQLAIAQQQLDDANNDTDLAVVRRNDASFDEAQRVAEQNRQYHEDLEERQQEDELEAQREEEFERLRQASAKKTEQRQAQRKKMEELRMSTHRLFFDDETESITLEELYANYKKMKTDELKTLMSDREYESIPKRGSKPLKIDLINFLMTQAEGHKNPSAGGAKRGKGLRRGVVVYGRGVADTPPLENVLLERTEPPLPPAPPSSKNRFHIHSGKYYLDLKRLSENTLVVKYTTSNATLPLLPIQRISNAVKVLLEDITRNQFHRAKYDELGGNDKRLVKRIVKATKLDIDLGGGKGGRDKDDEEFQKQYDIVLGEYNSGNTSPAIKEKLKRFVVEAMNDGLVPKQQALYLLYQLSC